jgi:predicted dehydrogenase
MKVAVVGAGLIGSRRARVAASRPDTAVVAVADVDQERARTTATECGAQHVAARWEDVVLRDDVDAVIVSTVNKWLTPVALAAAVAGKHVLVEKPVGRNLQEVSALADQVVRSGVAVKAGFNLRHHPAMSKAHEKVSKGDIGDVIFIRAVYGHGGRPGYETEWRGDPDLAGGGELLDQGIHIADLVNWFIGPVRVVYCRTETLDWPVAPLEDNAFAILRAQSGAMVSFHTSWTQWRNRFTFEVYGRTGAIEISGLGGSYGVERLVTMTRRVGGAPDETVEEFTGDDTSWRLEWDEFVTAIREQRAPSAGISDALAAMRLVDAMYRSARTGVPVRL